MSGGKEECYFCGRDEDEVWLTPSPDGEEYICDECEASGAPQAHLRGLDRIPDIDQGLGPRQLDDPDDIPF